MSIKVKIVAEQYTQNRLYTHPVYLNADYRRRGIRAVHDFIVAVYQYLASQPNFRRIRTKKTTNHSVVNRNEFLLLTVAQRPAGCV